MAAGQEPVTVEELKRTVNELGRALAIIQERENQVQQDRKEIRAMVADVQNIAHSLKNDVVRISEHQGVQTHVLTQMENRVTRLESFKETAVDKMHDCGNRVDGLEKTSRDLTNNLEKTEKELTVALEKSSDKLERAMAKAEDSRVNAMRWGIGLAVPTLLGMATILLKLFS